jgi:thiamine biosynthesis lipoprotein
LSAVCILLRAAIVYSVFSYGNPAPADPSLYKQARRIMGTFCEVQVYDSNSARAEKAIAAALDEMQRVDRLLSNYNAASELSKINREAGRSPVRASNELYGFLKACRSFHNQTLGAFDPTVGPLVRAWGFFSPRPAVPSAPEIAAARLKSGFDKVILNDKGRTVFYAVAGMEIDPGGIGKGYAVDRAVGVLKKWKIPSALVSAGGSTLYAVGHPPGLDSWRIAIKNPANDEQPYAMAALRDNAISTSGISEKSVPIAGHRYSHIFDPRTGEPVEGVCQVSVVTSTATESDALTKAAFILPRDTITQLFSKQAGIHALKIEGVCDATGSRWTTPWSLSVFVWNHGPQTSGSGDERSSSAGVRSASVTLLDDDAQPAATRRIQRGGPFPAARQSGLSLRPPAVGSGGPCAQSNPPACKDD